MATHKVRAHNVDATQITHVGPLIAAGRMMGPTEGLKIALENGRTQNWLSEKDGYVPTVGDFFVVDADLKVAFIVPKAKFAELFAEVE